jgi:hypothetical protein
MRRIVAAEYLSLDGVTEDPGPSGEYEHRGWTLPYWNDDISKWQTDRCSRATHSSSAGSPTRSSSPPGRCGRAIPSATG